MKKIIAISLAIMLMLGLCACSETPSVQKGEESTLKIGFGRADITPENSVPMSGFSGTRMSTDVLSRLYTTCIAMNDGNTTILLYSQDLHYTTSVLTPTLRNNIAMGVDSAYTLSAHRIYIASTGTYFGPNMKSSDPSMVAYMEKYNAAMVSAAQEALEDMAPATLSQTAVDATDSLKTMESSGVGSYNITYTCYLNHEDDDKLEEAAQVMAEQKKNGNYAADQLAKKLGLKSLYTASMISKRKSWKEKDTVEVSGIRVGGLGIAMAPCKLFGTTGQSIRKNSPAEITFVLCEANAAWPAVASEEAFTYGCYESYTSTFARGTAEKMANAMVETIIMSKK